MLSDSARFSPSKWAGKRFFSRPHRGRRWAGHTSALELNFILHNTAVGKAILANLPRMRVEQILDTWGLPEETENTITDRETLYAELETVREQGYAINPAENFKELYGIGVAATDHADNVIGAFSVTGPEHSLSGPEKEASIADTVVEIVNEYELELALV